jgi:protein-S-isoprenylcysteine O-methyltransferase Ste14
MTEHSLFVYLLWIWFPISAGTFLALLLISAPYGRHARGGWGPQVSARTGWLIMEAPAALMIAGVVVYWGAAGPAAWALLGLWELHYVNRAFIYPFRVRSDGKQMPLLIALFGALFNIVNGWLNGRSLSGLGPTYGVAWLHDPRFLGGAALFFVGMAINWHSDQVLRNLRRPGESGYKIPRGGLYGWVSCPNYLGEIVEWSGFALACWSPAGLAFVVWTAANLVPRAITHHRWYRQTFSDYPRERRAIFPYLF